MNNRRTKNERNNPKKSYYDIYKKEIGAPILWEYVFPIYLCNKTTNTVDVNNISGTAFYIGNSYFMTASHVLDYDTKYNNHQQIGYLNQIKEGAVERYDFEIIERFYTKDIAIIKSVGITSSSKKPKSFHWHHSKLKYYSTIRAMGYPSGYDPVKKFTIPRAFQGTRVGGIQYQKNEVDAFCNELSFHCLRGLSGTCLIDEGYQIHGIVIGNSKEELNFYEEIEEEKTENEGSFERYTYMKSEAVFIGLAVDKSDIFKLHSTHFQMSIHDYLVKNNIHKCHCSE